jgi:hypothetical protein
VVSSGIFWSFQIRDVTQYPELDPGSTPPYPGPKAPSTTACIYTRILAEDIVSDQDWYRYVLKYPDQAITFYNTGHRVIRHLVPTLYEINPDLSQSPQPSPQASVNSQQCFHGFADSELYAQPTVIPQHIAFPNPTSITQRSSSGLSDCMDIDSPA